MILCYNWPFSVIRIKDFILKIPVFLYDLQQPTKKLSNPDYFKDLEASNKKEDCNQQQC